MTDEVKPLSDDALREITERPYITVGWGRRIELTPEERDALCATVRTLRERLDGLNTLGEEMLTRLEKVAGIGTKADHGWYFVIGEVERQHTALREQLAQTKEALTVISQKEYDVWAFGQVVGLAKRVIEALAKEKEQP